MNDYREELHDRVKDELKAARDLIEGLRQQLVRARHDRARLLGFLHAVAVGKRDDVVEFLANWNQSRDRGGCWFCGRGGATLFCPGWDAFYHQACLDEARKNDPDNPELQEFA